MNGFEDRFNHSKDEADTPDLPTFEPIICPDCERRLFYKASDYMTVQCPECGTGMVWEDGYDS